MHTRASQIVWEFAQRHLQLIHAARREVLCAVVSAVMAGHLLTLSRLARALVGHSTQRAALKRVDRLIGNARIGRESEAVAAALLCWWCRSGSPLVIAVDWSEVAPGGAFVELRAALTPLGAGRGLTVYQAVYPRSKLSNGPAERRLLKRLAEWIPPEVSVIITTDAGFRRPWFAAVERLGWGWIGRIRRGVCVSRDGLCWSEAREWFAKATRKPSRWSDCWFTRQFRFACDIVLYRRRALGGKRYGRIGHVQRPKERRKAQAGAREPWLLAHSRQLRTFRADEIVALYERRMQIEENFRDSKSIALGMGLEASQSRSAQRLQALLLIGTLAAFLLWHVGQLAEAEGLHQQFKATTRSRRELSVVSLGKLLCWLDFQPLTEFAMRALRQRLGLNA
jgi:Transposase DDE domain